MGFQVLLFKGGNELEHVDGTIVEVLLQVQLLVGKEVDK
jgi:hypothetical protein